MSIPFTLSSSFGAVSRTHTRRLVCFGLVGLVGTLVNTAVLACLVEFGAWDYLISAVVATELAILTNFVLNDRWTFRNRVSGAPWLGRLGRYNAVALVLQREFVHELS